MNIETVSVGPKEATEMLGSNIDNRKQTLDHVAFLATQMASGKWKFCADPIRFGKSGRLIDGQHRLLAVIKSNTVQEFLVIRGLDDEVFDALDSGRNRKASDILSIEKIPNSTFVAALIGMILAYERGMTSILRGGMSGGGKATARAVKKISNAEILDFARENDLSEYIAYGRQCNSVLSIYTQTEYAFLKYVFDKISVEDSSTFLERLSSGIGLDAGSPILLLRNKMIENKSNVLKMTGTMKAQLTFKAWNYFRENRAIKVLQYSQSENIIIPR